MRTISIPLASAGMVITAIIGIGVGYYLTPEYRLSMYDTYDMNLGMPDRWLDLRYINSMISHHRGAMLLAEQVQTTSERQELRDLSAKILADEPAAIAELYAWKKDWYGDGRPVRDPSVSQLGAYDSTFDLRFLNALIAHHEAGLVMTAEVSRKSSRSEVLSNADAVTTFLTTTGTVLRTWRNEWYAI